MKLVFMGTPEFAVPSLDSVCASAEVMAVVTQPDRPAGRGHKPRSSPVKIKAAKKGLPVYQPEKVGAHEFVRTMREMAPDAIVVVAFGQKIPPEILYLPRYGCINVHASLLPRYRGAAPVNWALINGDAYTGVTTMLMDEGWDTGGILLQRKVRIDDDWDAGDLHDVLAVEGAKLLVETLMGLENGNIAARPQDESSASSAPKITSELCRIDWAMPSESIRNLVRGLSPWPGAFTVRRSTGSLAKVFKVRIVDLNPNGEDLPEGRPGEVIWASSLRGLCVRTGDGVLELLEVQPENARRMSGVDYINGYGIKVSEMLGEPVEGKPLENETGSARK